jgi:hypothetical protein
MSKTVRIILKTLEVFDCYSLRLKWAQNLDA